MEGITKKQLQEKLWLHELWLLDEPEGEKLNLSKVDLSGAEEELEDAEDKAYEEEYEDGKNFAGDDD